MTPRIARNIIARRRAEGAAVRRYLKRLVGAEARRGARESAAPAVIAARPSSSWVVTSTSWTDMRLPVPTNSELCSAEFADWTMFEEATLADQDTIVSESMALFSRWTSGRQPFVGRFGCTLYSHFHDAQCFEDRIFEDRGMTAFVPAVAVPEENDEEVLVEPETHDSLLLAALISTRDVLPMSSAALLRTLSCPDLLMHSLAQLLFETQHLFFLNDRFNLPAPPKWMTQAMEMDPPNSLATTISLPSGWDNVVSARLSSSSIFNLFSDPPSPTLSFFDIDPTGASSTSTIYPPTDFWRLPSTSSSITGHEWTPSSSMETDVDLLKTESDAPVCCCNCPPESDSEDLTARLLSQYSMNNQYELVHSDDSSYESDEDSEVESRLTYTVSDDDGYESDCECSECEPLLPEEDDDDDDEDDDEDDDDDEEEEEDTDVMMSRSTQTEGEPSVQIKTLEMLRECDEMMAKIVELKKKLSKNV